MTEKPTTPFDGETQSDSLPDGGALPDEAAPPKTTIAESSDNAPPMNSPARGPMDQTTPDVATGSTPLTRRDE